ncbi:MAG: substrate-binding domain-containing protein [Sneathiella sp.]
MMKALRISVSALFLFLSPLYSHNAKADTLTIVGTGDGTHVLRALAKAYVLENPNQTVSIPPSVGSSGGVKLVGLNKNKLGRVARKINGDEEYLGLTYVPYARIPVAFYAHPLVDVKELSVDQILEIYRGDIRDWSEVKGRPGKIRVVRRERGDSSMLLLNKRIPAFSEIQFTEFMKVATSESQSVGLVSSVPGAIGFGPLPGVEEPDVSVLSLDGKQPSAKDYLLELVLALVFYEENNSGQIKGFVDYVTSSKGQKVIKDNQAIPY